MLALQGYYDGKTIQPLGEFPAKKNQKLIITVLDEFMSETNIWTGSRLAPNVRVAAKYKNCINITVR